MNIERDGSGWKFSQKSLKNDTFLLVGENDLKKFHKKVVYVPARKRFVSFEAIYLKSKASKYDPLVGTMSNSLKMLQGPDTGR